MTAPITEQVGELVRSVDEFIRHYFPRWWKETKGRPAPTIVVIPRPGVSR